MPAVRWADSGDAVPVDVLTSFAVQAVKAKSPEPNVMLRKYCALFDPADREAFGQYLLEAWLAEDVRPVTLEEAEVRATAAATQMLRYIAMYPQHYASDPANGKSLEQLTAEYLPSFAGQPAGSAVGAKGLLALVAACARERAAEPVARYLKEWYGQRAAQGKALIAMLGWIEHPSATQLMLSVGSRFRTKSFQEEATKQAEALAERKGWSVGELADRTIPSAGFDATGVIELSYGERVFSAVLRPELTIELRSPEGKKLSSLPAARQSENEEVVKAAKKSLALAKKELKAIVQLQSQRLYEALCTERTWLYDDWETYLNQHPVVRYLTQRLAWVATNGDGSTVFRPLDDGTLTDVDDNEVKLPVDAVIAIAHDSLLDGEVVKAWQEHLVDYEVRLAVPAVRQGHLRAGQGAVGPIDRHRLQRPSAGVVRVAGQGGQARLHPRRHAGRWLVLRVREAVPDSRADRCHDFHRQHLAGGEPDSCLERALVPAKCARWPGDRRTAGRHTGSAVVGGLQRPAADGLGRYGFRPGLAEEE